jgi:hypothetical protein
MTERRHVAVIAPTLNESGGTERILYDQLASVADRVSF